MHPYEIVLGLVVLALAVATLAGRLQAPAPSLLVAAGLVVGLLPHSPAVHLDPQVAAALVLPPLLYAAAGDVARTELRAVVWPVVTLATGLVVASAVAVAAVVHALRPEVGIAAAFVLGSALASTDPVAVSALARRLDLPPRLLALVQGESLFNDATSLVLVQVAIAAVVAGHVSAASSVERFLRLGAGGAAVGLLAALVAEFLRRRTSDPVLEVAAALLTPYACYVLAQALDTSGVTAVVVAGVRLGGRQLQVAGGPTRLRETELYAVLVFILESTVFAVVGLELPGLVRQLPAGDKDFVPVALAVAGTVVAARLAWTYPSAFARRLALRLTGRRPEPLADTWRVTGVLSWAGCRGVLPLVAALSIPLTVHGGGPFPHRALLLVLTTATVVLTLLVQGLTLAPLVARLGVGTDPGRLAAERSAGRRAAADAALARLEELADLEAAPAAQLGRLMAEVRAGMGAEEEPGAVAALVELRRDLLIVQGRELSRLCRAGVFGEATRRELQRELDAQEAALGGG